MGRYGMDGDRGRRGGPGEWSPDFRRGGEPPRRRPGYASEFSDARQVRRGYRGPGQGGAVPRGTWSGSYDRGFRRGGYDRGLGKRLRQGWRGLRRAVWFRGRGGYDQRW